MSLHISNAYKAIAFGHDSASIISILEQTKFSREAYLFCWECIKYGKEEVIDWLVKEGHCTSQIVNKQRSDWLFINNGQQYICEPRTEEPEPVICPF